MAKAITSSSTAEYFAKNLQQVGFSSPLKAVLTTLKEAVDNSLDACEENSILPEISVEVRKIGAGSGKSADLVEIIVEDNGPGLDPEDLPKVYGEYLASSKFGRGQATRGQQGIGISAAVTWAQLTNASGVLVTSKTSRMRKAFHGSIDVDIKQNKGVIKTKEMIDWDRPHGVRVEFRIDGRIQLNGDGGILTYLEGTTLVNPHLKLSYKLNDADWVKIERVSDVVPEVPPSTLPHPHTMKLGEFITHAGIFGKTEFGKFLKTGFSRVNDVTLKDLTKNGLPKGMLAQPVGKMNEAQFKTAFQVIGKTELQSPSTRSVLTVGEEAMAKSILRLGDVDFFSVVTRKPKICDFKPVVVEVALARFLNRGGEDQSIQLLRFANRVPLQFDKSACAITNAVESVNWRSYGLQQSKDSLPNGPYVFAVSIVSPFIKFKNASKETIDASDELVEEIRRALMQAGQKLSRHIRRENKEADLERKISHIEQFGPILVEGLMRISGAKPARKIKAEEGLKKLLGRDTKDAQKELSEADIRLNALRERQEKAGMFFTSSSRNEKAMEANSEESFDEEADVRSEEDSDSESRGTGKAAQGTAKGTTAKVVETKGVTTKTTATTAKATEKSATTGKAAEVSAKKTPASTAKTTGKTTDKAARK